MPDVVLYGISNCDTVRKARRWLEEHGVEYRFHDFREQGMASVPLSQWIERLGAGTLVNRRSTTWRNLSPPERARAEHDTAVLLSQHPTLIRRPVLASGRQLLAGFNADQYLQLID